MLHKIPSRLRVLSAILLLLYLFVVGGSLIPCFTDVHATSQSNPSFYAPFLTPFRYTTKNTSGTLTDEEVAELSSLVSHIPQTAYDAFLMDNPLPFLWIDLTASPTSIKYSVNRTGTEIVYTLLGLTHTVVPLDAYTAPAGMTQQIQERIASFTPSGTTMYEKVKSIHDYICRLASYSYDGSFIHSAYGALIERKAVCEGYAEAFKLLCDANGIDCLLISGVADNGTATENHLWNYVRMDDGKWYAVDATWNDGTVIQDRYFLIGSDTVVIRHSANDSEITFSGNHLPDGDINNAGIKSFSYPPLSHDAYLVNNPSGKASAYYEYGEATRYFYNQLDVEQQNFYYYLTQLTPPIGPGPTPTPAATDDLVETETDTTIPPITDPIVTDPITTNPIVTDPIVTDPIVTDPIVTDPIVTDPIVTDPIVTDPIVTDPIVTDPIVTDPIVTDPIVTDPIVTDPIVTDPIVTDPIVTDPIVTDPIVTDPIVTDPIVTDPIVTDPIVTDPIVTDPIVTDPIVTDPIATDPIVTDPIATDPIVTDPIVTNPIVTEPIVTDPVVTEPATTETTTTPITDPVITDTTVTNPITQHPGTTETPSTSPATTDSESKPAITLPPLSSTSPTPSPNNARDTLVYVLRVIVIVLALIALFLVVILTFLKISRSDKSV